MTAPKKLKSGQESLFGVKLAKNLKQGSITIIIILSTNFKEKFKCNQMCCSKTR